MKQNVMAGKSYFLLSAVRLVIVAVVCILAVELFRISANKLTGSKPASFAVFKGQNTTGFYASADEKETSESTDSLFAELLEPDYFPAIRLKAPSINLDLKLERVGVASDGTLEVPRSWDVGGWFSDGAKAGEEGNLLINAHYDDNFGRPAAFWGLKNISLGDRVLIGDKFGKEFEYKVTEKFYLDINSPDKARVFDSSKGKAEVTLVTCGGVWLPEQSTYSNRLIIKGELVG